MCAHESSHNMRLLVRTCSLTTKYNSKMSYETSRTYEECHKKDFKCFNWDFSNVRGVSYKSHQLLFCRTCILVNCLVHSVIDLLFQLFPLHAFIRFLNFWGVTTIKTGMRFSAFKSHFTLIVTYWMKDLWGVYISVYNFFWFLTSFLKILKRFSASDIKIISGISA